MAEEYFLVLEAGPLGVRVPVTKDAADALIESSEDGLLDGITGFSVEARGCKDGSEDPCQASCCEGTGPCEEGFCEDGDCPETCQAECSPACCMPACDQEKQVMWEKVRIFFHLFDYFKKVKCIPASEAAEIVVQFCRSL